MAGDHRGADTPYLLRTGPDHAASVTPARQISQVRNLAARRGQHQGGAHGLGPAGEIHHHTLRWKLTERPAENRIEVRISPIRVVLVVFRQRIQGHFDAFDPIPHGLGERLGHRRRQQDHPGPGVRSNGLPQRNEKRFFELRHIAGPDRQDQDPVGVLLHVPLVARPGSALRSAASAPAPALGSRASGFGLRCRPRERHFLLAG